MPPPQGEWNPIEGPGDYTTTATIHNDTYAAIDPTKADLTGKAVLVTGASRGLGRSMALSFAKAGASHLAIAARSGLAEMEKDLKTAARKAGRKEPQILSLKLDIADVKSVTTATGQIEATFGKLDIVINNAGKMENKNLIGDSDPEDWWNTFAVNLRGPYLIMRACLPLLLNSELKTVATVASVGAWVVTPSLSGYQTSKVAAVRLSQFFATEYKEQGIISFSIHPGNILTDMVGSAEELPPALAKVFTETPDLCADSLVYLTKEPREWISGRYINCTWDLPELEAKRKEIVDRDLLKIQMSITA